MDIINNNKKRMEKSKMIAVSIKPSEHQKIKEIANMQQISLSKLLIQNTLKNED